jgi:hypothetical protein
MSDRKALRARAWSRPMRVVWSSALAGLSVFAVSTLAGQAGAGAVAATPRATHAATASKLRPALTIGNTACGDVALTPASKVVGGTKLSVKFDWKGSPSNSKCAMPTTDCGSVYFGECNAGYWLTGVFCNTLASKNIATGQADCDLNNIVVFTDYNAGPNDPTDNTGTSYNQCTTTRDLGDVFGGLPGILYCIADGSTGDGWTDNWALGSASGSATGPAEATGYAKAPFKPSAAGIDCPPSAANIKAGAIPNTCAFVIIPVSFTYTCFGGCVPDPSLPNDGRVELTKDYVAAIYQYATPKKGTK